MVAPGTHPTESLIIYMSSLSALVHPRDNHVSQILSCPLHCSPRVTVPTNSKEPPQAGLRRVLREYCEECRGHQGLTPENTPLPSPSCLTLD